MPTCFKQTSIDQPQNAVVEASGAAVVDSNSKRDISWIASQSHTEIPMNSHRRVTQVVDM